jgi:flagellar basal body-associated protein FliL
MRDKKQKSKKISQKGDDKNFKTKHVPHVFEVHTMQGDNEAQNSQSATMKKNAPPSVIASTTLSQQSNTKTVSQKKNAVPTRENPFLSESANTVQDNNKGSFAPGKIEEPVEKINYTPDDIVSKGNDNKKPKKAKKQKKSMGIIMIILVIIFLLGAIGFAAYFFLFNKPSVPVIEDESNNNIEENQDASTGMPQDNIDDTDQIVIEVPDETESQQQTYSTELPNYFSFDVESSTSEADIATELTNIASNIQKQDIVEPISFIITDKNNNPVSFNVFAMSSGITLTQDILSALEENFEFYAYNDGANGVRFGFVIDVKDADALRTAITTNETTLPEAFDPFLNDMGSTAVNVVFADSAYKTHPIRYFNLNTTETYSVDYTINNLQWVVGTSKNTMRAILDVMKTDTPLTNDAGI